MRVNIRVKDVNDNPPEFATNNEVLMCESVAPGKVNVCVCVCLSVGVCGCEWVCVCSVCMHV